MAIVASQTVATVGAPLALTMAAGTVGAGTGTIVASGSATQIVLVDGFFQLEAGTASVTMTLNAGTVPFRRFLAGTAGDVMELTSNPGAEYRLGTNTPLTIVASSGTIGYAVRYMVE